MKKLLVAFSLLLVSPVAAQWQTPNHSTPVGQGVGQTGFRSAAPGAAGGVLTSNGATSDPSYQAIPSSVTSLGGVTGNLDIPISVTSGRAATNADCESTLALSGNTVFTMTFSAPSAYLCKRFRVANVDVYTGPGSGRGKLIIAPGVVNFWLMPGQVVDLVANAVSSSSWQPPADLIIPDASVPTIGYIGRWKLPTTTVLNTGGGSDTTQDGLAAGSSGLGTIQHALNVACSAFDQQLQTFTIQVADGTYTTPLHLCNMVGFNTLGGHTELVLSGDTGTLGNTIVSTTNANAFSAVGLYTPWRIQGFKISATGVGNCVQADGHSFLYVGNNIYNGCANTALLASYDSMLEAVDNYSVTAGGTNLYAAQYHSLVDIASWTVTLSGTPAFSGATASALIHSAIEAQSASFAGTGATGTRYSAFGMSIIDTGTGSGTFFPGNAGGSVNCTTGANSIGTCGEYN